MTTYFFGGEIGYDDGEVLLDADDETGLALIAAADDLDVFAHLEVLLELGGDELDGLLELLVVGHHAHLVAIDANNCARQVEQLALAHLDHVALHEVVRLVERRLAEQSGRLGIDAVGRLLEALQLGEGRLDTLGDDCRERKVLDEEAARVVAVVLEYPVLFLLERRAAHTPHTVRIEELLRRPQFALEEATGGGGRLLVLGLFERATLVVEVNARYELESDAILCGVDALHLGEIVLVDGALHAHPRADLEARYVLDDAQHVGHLLEGHHLLLPDAHAQVAHLLDGRLDVRLLVGLDVDEAAQALLHHHALDEQRLLVRLAQVRVVLAHEQQRRCLLLALSTLDRPQVRVPTRKQQVNE